jgi:hypothetical protein
MYGVVGRKKDYIAKRCFTQLNMRMADVDWGSSFNPRLAIVVDLGSPLILTNRGIIEELFL